LKGEKDYRITDRPSRFMIPIKPPLPRRHPSTIVKERVVESISVRETRLRPKHRDFPNSLDFFLPASAKPAPCPAPCRPAPTARSRFFPRFGKSSECSMPSGERRLCQVCLYSLYLSRYSLSLYSDEKLAFSR
jgi:hypothetical protein